MWMTDIVCPLNSGVHSYDCRVAVAEQPENPRHQGKVRHAGILASGTGSQSLLLGACDKRLNGSFDRFAGTDEMSHEKANHGLPAHCIEQRWSIAARLGEMKQDRDRFLGNRQLTANDAPGGQPKHDL